MLMLTFRNKLLANKAKFLIVVFITDVYPLVKQNEYLNTFLKKFMRFALLQNAKFFSNLYI
jgi:hypothetical protein